MNSGIPVSFRIFYDLPKDDTKELGSLKKPEPLFKIGEEIWIKNQQRGIVVACYERDNKYKYNVATWTTSGGQILVSYNEESLFKTRIV